MADDPSEDAFQPPPPESSMDVTDPEAAAAQPEGEALTFTLLRGVPFRNLS